MAKNSIGVAGVYLFGSVARGDVDGASDTDVLIVYERNAHKSTKIDAKSYIAATVTSACSFAEYSRERLEEMFAAGHLFAWHLFQEAVPLKVHGLAIATPIVFARPNPYPSAMTDADNFAELLKSSAERATDSAASLVYEAGIAYVALRNIGMSLSGALLPRPVFTRWSPFAIADVIRKPPSFSPVEYEQLIAARHASQRGSDAPSFERKSLLNQLNEAYSWATSVIEIARGKISA